MNENLKECKILGYKPFTHKETHEEMIRICLCKKSDNEGYIGEEAAYVFLPYDGLLEKQLNEYVLGNPQRKIAYYKTTDDIITGKTKVKEIIIK